MGKYKPSLKESPIAEMLETMTDRNTAIENDMCIRKPYGCGEPIGPFRDALSEKEYTISGLCQTCQDSVFDSVFNEFDDDEEDDGIVARFTDGD